MNRKKENDLINALRKRDQKAVETFLQDYTALIRYIIAPILQSPEEREECISEVAMRVWEKIDQYDIKSNSWISWISAIARNAALNRARKIKYTENIDAVQNEIPSNALTPEEIVLKKEREKALYAALNRLSLNDRLLFFRKYYYRQSTAQIASELGMSERRGYVSFEVEVLDEEKVENYLFTYIHQKVPVVYPNVTAAEFYKNGAADSWKKEFNTALCIETFDAHIDFDNE